jgi:hypothetical protein
VEQAMLTNFALVIIYYMPMIMMTFATKNGIFASKERFGRLTTTPPPILFATYKHSKACRSYSNDNLLF